MFSAALFLGWRFCFIFVLKMAATPNPTNNAAAYGAAEVYFQSYDSFNSLTQQKSDIESAYATKTYTGAILVQTLKADADLYKTQLSAINAQIDIITAQRAGADIILIRFFTDNPSSYIENETATLFIYLDHDSTIVISNSIS